MIAIESIDTSRLRKRTSDLMAVLVGRGAGDGDIQRAVKTEAGQCAWKISQTIGPRTLSEAEQQVVSEVCGKNERGGHLSTKITKGKLDYGEESSWPDWKWVAAGPSFLVGMFQSDDLRGRTADEVLAAYRASRKVSAKRGNKYVQVGAHGKQHIYRLNRILTTESTLNAVIKMISERFGQARASFAATSQQLVPSKRIPGFVREKIEMVLRNGKHIMVDSATGNPITPAIEFGSRAPGVQNNPRMVAKIQSAIDWSERTLLSKIRKVIKGQTYNFNTGQVFNPTDFNEN